MASDRQSILHTTVTKEDEKATVIIVGRLTVGSSPELDAVLMSLLREGVVDFRLDMSQTDYLSSSGLRVIVTVAKHVAQRGGSVVIVSPSPEVREVLVMTGLTSVLNIEG